MLMSAGGLFDLFFFHPAQMRIPIDLFGGWNHQHITVRVQQRIGLWSGNPENMRASDNLNNP